MTSYGGILTAMLTVPRVTIPIDSLADLVTQTDLTWHNEAGSSLLTYFRESADELHQKVHRGQGPNIKACLNERQNIADGKLAAICDDTTMMKAMADDFSETGECHLYITREKVLSHAIMALAFTKHSLYLAKTNQLVQVVLEAGLWNKWLGDQLANSSRCLRHPQLDRRQRGLQPIDMDSFIGPLLLLLLGEAQLPPELLGYCSLYWLPSPYQPSLVSTLVTHHPRQTL
ncbi:putative Glutamate receptor ionotropic, kainate 1-like 6, partial [Homarus americanus]